VGFIPKHLNSPLDGGSGSGTGQTFSGETLADLGGGGVLQVDTFTAAWYCPQTCVLLLATSGALVGAVMGRLGMMLPWASSWRLCRAGLTEDKALAEASPGEEVINYVHLCLGWCGVRCVAGVVAVDCM
jgi:hypothetical protein